MQSQAANICEDETGAASFGIHHHLHLNLHQKEEPSNTYGERICQFPMGSGP